MKKINRRAVLAGTATGGLAAGASIAGLTSLAVADPAEDSSCPPPTDAARIDPGDSRYPDLVTRGTNERFRSEPEYVHLVSTTEQVEDAVKRAVAAGKRVVVRSGGHCFEDFVDNAETQVIIDMSTMTKVYFDPRHRAFAIEPGALLGDVYRRLFLGWGVTLPLGSCPGVGAGGHIMGGGHGAMSRLHGLGVDHLYAVEVVTVDADGGVKTTVATRRKDDPHRDLWWAHTGAGGGNFGVVTRYWMRSPGVKGDDPAGLLPRPPAEVLDFSLVWTWDSMDRDSFSRLVSQHGQWHEENSEPGSPANRLHSGLLLFGTELGVIILNGQVVGRGAERRLGEYLAAVTEGVVTPSEKQQRWTPWLRDRLSAGDSEDILGTRYKSKTGYLRKRLTDEQIDVLWEYLSAEPGSGPQGAVWMVSCGGEVNAVDPDATVVVQRDSMLKVIYMVSWASAGDDDAHLTWVRNLYRDVYSGTGGVPAHDERNGGCFINYPDSDLADPNLNESGVPWHELYYKDNYSRLRKVKAAWDPRNVFRHSLSVRPPD